MAVGGEGEGVFAAAGVGGSADGEAGVGGSFLEGVGPGFRVMDLETLGVFDGDEEGVAGSEDGVVDGDAGSGVLLDLSGAGAAFFSDGGKETLRGLLLGTEVDDEPLAKGGVADGHGGSVDTGEVAHGGLSDVVSPAGEGGGEPIWREFFAAGGRVVGGGGGVSAGEKEGGTEEGEDGFHPGWEVFLGELFL